jgi:hypothetical protein
VGANPESFFSPLSSGERDWDDLRRYTVPLRTHLQNTAFMVGGSAWTGDLAGVRWSTDLLLRWFETARRAWGDGLRVDHSSALDAGLITTTLLNKPWEEVLALPLWRFDRMELAPSTVFSTAIGNLWRDTELILACLLIRWATAGGPNGAAAIAARMILRHEVYDRSFYSDNLAPFLRVEGALSALFRMVASGRRLSDGYTAGISQMVSQIDRITEAPYVSQRIYSSWGFHDIYELAREKAVVLAALVPDALAVPVRLPEDITRLLHQVSSDDQAARRLQDYLGSIRTALDGFDVARDGTLLAGLRKTQDAHGLDGWRNSAAALITVCLDVLSAQRDERIRMATIDPNRLREIALAGSKTGFDNKSGAFPIGLFPEVIRTAQVLQTWTYRERHARGELTIPLMAQLVSNEESWWAKRMRDYAAIVVLHDVLTTARLEEVGGETPEAWWSAVKAAAGVIEAAGGKPVVLVANLAAPGWLNDWLWEIPGSSGAKRPADLHVERSSEDVGPGYAMHLNQLPVFHAPVEATCSYVMPIDILRRVEFTEFAPGQTVLVEFEDDQSDAWNGVLSASIARRVTLGDGKIVRVRFAAEEVESAFRY